MTTQTDMDLLERIARFDKSRRQSEVGPGVTVITYSTALGWFIEEELQTGSSFTVSEDLIPVTASQSELGRILDRIPAPGETGMRPIDPRDINEPLGLVSAAEELLTRQGRGGTTDPDEVGSALWRLVDAAGMLSELLDPDASGKRNRPTGHGYFIDRIVPRR